MEIQNKVKYTFSVLDLFIDFQQRNTNNKQRDRNNYHMIYYRNTHLPGDFVEQFYVFKN